jgi:FKBP-type peptidyl-prolyl cis-trans isomerase
MKKSLGLLFLPLGILTILLFTGCAKDSACEPVPVENELSRLEAFNTSIGMNATKHSTGFFYEILAPGAAGKPLQGSTLYVKYKGTLLDGKVFDQQTNPGATGFVLVNLIDAWKYSIPMIGKGGKIRITTPSALGYGCQPSGDIPANSPLFFEIELVDFF